jgi:hypothetical protein
MIGKPGRVLAGKDRLGLIRQSAKRPVGLLINYQRTVFLVRKKTVYFSAVLDRL